MVADTVTLQVGQVLSIFAQAVTSLVLLRVLGPGLVEVYAVSSALVAAAALLDLTGANRVALTELAYARGAATDDGATPALAAFLRVSAMIKVPVVIGLWMLAPYVATLAYGQPEVGRWARWLSLPLLFDVPFSLIVLVLQGHRHMRRLVQVETTRVLLESIATVAVLAAGGALPGVIAVRVAASVTSALWAIRAYARLATRSTTMPPWSRLLGRMRSIRTSAQRRFGLAMAIEKNVANLGGQLPVLLLGALKPGVVGYYVAAARVMAFPAPLVSAFARNLDVVLPFEAGRGLASLRRAFTRATAWSGGLWAIVTTALLLVAPVVLVKLAGPAYTPALVVLPPLAVQSLAVGFGVGLSSVLRAMGKPAYGAALQALSLVVTVPIGILLIDRLGAPGAAWFHASRFLLYTASGLVTVRYLLRKPAAS